MGSRSWFWNVPWALLQGDKVWHGNQLLTLSSRSLYSLLIFANIFSAKIIIFFLWNFVETEVVYFFKKKTPKKLCSEVCSLFMAIASLIILLKDQDEQVSEGCLCVSNHSHGGTFMHKLLFLWKFGGTRWEDVSTGALFKRLPLT